MQQILLELLEISELNEIAIIMEDLGNLKQLELGPLINTFKQGFNSYGKPRSMQLGTTEVGNKFRQFSGIGRESEITDGPQVKSWANVKKILVNDDSVRAISFRVNGKAVAVLIAHQSDVKSSSDAVGLAWDLTKGGLSKEEQDSILNALGKPVKSNSDSVESYSAYEYEKKNALKQYGNEVKTSKEVKYTSYEDWVDAAKDTNKATLEKDDSQVKAIRNKETIGVWDKKKSTGFITVSQEPFNRNIDTVYGKVKQLTGVAQTVAMAADFFNVLCKAAVVNTQLVHADVKGLNKKKERLINPPIEPKDLLLFKENIKIRLAKYKNTKLVTVEDAKEFMVKVFEGGLKKIKLAGHDYFATPDAKYLGSNRSDRGNKYVSYSDKTMKDLIAGKNIDMAFSADSSTGDYNTLFVTVKLSNGSLVPVEARYFDENNIQVKETF